MYWVPANQRLTRPMWPSAARVPISDDSRARTIGLVGASGASRLMQRSPRHSSLRLTASMTACAQARGDSVARMIALAFARTCGSCTSNWRDSSGFMAGSPQGAFYREAVRTVHGFLQKSTSCGLYNPAQTSIGGFVSPILITVFTLVSGISWTIVYVDLINRGLRDKTYGMPFFALAFNISWEFIYAFVIYQGSPLQRAVNVVWFALDVVILVTYFKYGRLEFPKPVERSFIPWSVAGLVVAFATVYFAG